MKEKQEKERIEAELELIKRERFRIKQLANKKFGKDLKTNWEIAQARVKDAGKGKPLYKLIYFCLKTDWVETNVNELAEVTGKSEKEIYSAYNWLKKKLRG